MLETKATANSTAKASSVRVARHIGNTQNGFRTCVRLPDSPAITNQRRWGAYDASNGFFFEQNGGNTLRVVVRRGGTDYPVALADGTIAQDGNFHAYEIRYSISKVYFYIDSVLVYSQSLIGTEGVLTQALNFPVVFETINSGGETFNATIETTHGIISRLGQLHTTTKYANITTNTTTLLKRTAGRLYRVIIGNPAGTVTIYDNTTNSAPIIGTLTLGASQPVNSIEFDAHFSTGLTIVTSSNSVNITVVYE